MGEFAEIKENNNGYYRTPNIRKISKVEFVTSKSGFTSQNRAIVINNQQFESQDESTPLLNSSKPNLQIDAIDSAAANKQWKNKFY